MSVFAPPELIDKRRLAEAAVSNPVPNPADPFGYTALCKLMGIRPLPTPEPKRP